MAKHTTDGGPDPVDAKFASGLNGEAPLSHNLAGQKLGRKGRHTRERILAATAELLADESNEPLSLSAVARRANLGMTSLYNYFTDLTELLLAVLEPVMASAEEGWLALLRERWADEDLGAHCDKFMEAYHAFWSRHARLLHLRNAMADAGDRRMKLHRVHATRPVIGWMVRQMDADPLSAHPDVTGMATVLITGTERVVTVSTDVELTDLFRTGRRHPAAYYLGPTSRLMEMAIRDMRARNAPDAAA
ncbi:MAG: TetR/AcrR family transcriptional regulator [Novosphingobium sp.]